MARLVFKKIKKGMVFRSNGVGRSCDRIFRVTNRTHKPKRVFMDAPASFTEEDQWQGMVNLEFTMEQINQLLEPLPEETSGWFVKKKECVILKEDVCPHAVISGKTCSACKVPDKRLT